MRQVPHQIVKFSDIRLNHGGFTNSRTAVGDVDDLAQSISSNGLIDSPIVWLAEDGTLCLISGYRRYTAILRIRETDPTAFDEIDVGYFEGSLDDAMAKNFEENAHKKDLNPADECEYVTKMYDRIERAGGTQTDVAKKIGFSQPWVSQKISLFRGLCKEALDALRGGVISLSMAKKISRILNPDGTPNEPEQLLILEKIRDGIEKSTVKIGEAKEKVKTSRSKAEIEELDKMLDDVEKDGLDVEPEHLKSIRSTIAWLKCRIDVDQLITGEEPETDIPVQVDSILQDNPQPVEEDEGVRPQPKRRIRIED